MTAYKQATTKTWVNVNDANYPTCVPCFGKNLVEDASTSGQDSSYFEYEFSIGTGDYNHNCGSNLAAGSTGWARTPYPCIVTQIYDDSLLQLSRFMTAGKERMITSLEQGLLI